MCDVFNMIGIVPFNRKQLEKDTESQRVGRLLGFEKFKVPQRNLIGLQNCKSLEDYPLTDEDLSIILDTEEENYRTGCFTRIFPLKTNVDQYSQYFLTPRYNNTLVWKHLKSPTNVLLKYFRQNSALINV